MHNEVGMGNVAGHKDQIERGACNVGGAVKGVDQSKATPVNKLRYEWKDNAVTRASTTHHHLKGRGTLGTHEQQVEQTQPDLPKTECGRSRRSPWEFSGPSYRRHPRQCPEEQRGRDVRCDEAGSSWPSSPLSGYIRQKKRREFCCTERGTGLTQRRETLTNSDQACGLETNGRLAGRKRQTHQIKLQAGRLSCVTTCLNRNGSKALMPSVRHGFIKIRMKVVNFIKKISSKTTLIKTTFIKNHFRQNLT